MTIVTQEELDRINELYHKSKSPEGLTPEEKEEQAALRKKYIASFRDSLRGTLNSISIVEEDGSRTDLGETHGGKLRKKALIFDVDGTLWDTVDTVTDSWNDAIDTVPEIHKNIDREELKKELGKPMRQIFEDLFPEIAEEYAPEEADRLYSHIDDICTKYEADWIERQGGIVYPNVKETFENLSGFLDLYIVSNCQKGYIEECVRWAGIGEYVKDFLCYGDTKATKDITIRALMEKNRISEAYYIGDTLGDAKSSNDAGVDFIWASYGFGDVPEDMYKAKISSISELEELF